MKIDSKVKSNELKVALFLAEHHLPFSCADHLVNLIKSIDEKSRDLQQMCCERMTGTSLVTGVFGSYELINLLRNYEKSNFRYL